jgi:hypothetical protein
LIARLPAPVFFYKLRAINPPQPSQHALGGIDVGLTDWLAQIRGQWIE